MNHELHQKGYQNAVIKFVERAYTRQFNIWASEGEFSKICTDESFVSMCQRLTVKDTGYFLVTINPKVDFSMDVWQQLHTLATYLCGLKVVPMDAWWVLEQRSEDVRNPHGPHMHMLIEANSLKKSDVLKRVQSAVQKQKWGYESNVDIRHRSKASLDYIKGDKSSDKTAKLDVDRRLRDHYGYEHWYQKSVMDL